jgi:lysozyme
VSGVDVSAYDSGTIWSTVQHSGEGYTFIKATEGITYISPDFTSDWAASQKAGLLRGAYHFFHPGDNPTEAAAVFLKTMGTLQASDLPAVLDWEVTDGVSNAVQIQNALIWLNQVETATGKVPIIYVAPAFWNALGNPTSFARYPLYIANYSVTCPTIPPPWSDWVFWQKSESGKVSGVQNTAVDLDVFNGNPQQLTQFAKTGSL